LHTIAVTDDAALAAATAQLAAAPRLALDTEFMRERTYYAELAFVQIADAHHITLIDPLSSLDRAGLGALLSVPGQLKVLHAARQDIEVLLPLTGTPVSPVLDTQLAAALLGFAPQIGYGDLIARELGISLEKGQARTDWTRRPLSEAQLAYAADDVRYLLPLAEKLEERLDGLGRLGWLWEDLALLANPALYTVDPANAWQRLKGVETLPPAEQQRVRVLCAWRESRAARRNLPRGWVLTDEGLRTIARIAPGDLVALKGLEVMAPGTVEKLGPEILAALADARLLPLEGIVQRQDARPSPEERDRTQRLSECVRQIATELAIAPEVLAPQRELRRLARGEALVEVLAGWRLATLSAPLELELARG
jgi:ribonuclease D